VVFLDQRQGEIDAGRDAGGGVERAVLEEEGIGIDPQAGKAPRQIAREAPVRRDRPAGARLCRGPVRAGSRP